MRKLLGAEKIGDNCARASTGLRKAPVLTRQNGKPHDSQSIGEYTEESCLEGTISPGLSPTLIPLNKS